MFHSHVSLQLQWFFTFCRQAFANQYTILYKNGKKPSRRAKRVSRERASERRSPSALRSLVLARHAQIGELSRRLEKAKIVECKIRSMRSRLLFLLSGVFSPVGRHHLKRTWTRSRDLTEFPGCKGLKTR